MTVRNAALLALVASVLQTILTVWRLVFGVLNAARGLIPVLMVVALIINAFAALSLALFFCVFLRMQSR